ncbi:unannotated protein [freshwater metagenome]|uniref:Unannotated protein n=1 Tax=freshwater metagenome TaxID=449393 RepID=A0A6J7FJ99_9ZZZZ
MTLGIPGEVGEHMARRPSGEQRCLTGLIIGERIQCSQQPLMCRRAASNVSIEVS